MQDISTTTTGRRRRRGVLRGLAVAAGLGVLAVGPSANADSRPVNEGGDSRPCVTYRESQAVFLGMTRHRTQRVLDTDGVPTGRRQLAQYGAAAGLSGLIPPATAVRSYAVCVDPGIGGGTFLVQYGAQGRVNATFYQDHQ